MKEEDCKEFLDKNIENIHMTDFSTQSIGVIPFGYKKSICKITENVLPAIVLLSLLTNH